MKEIKFRVWDIESEYMCVDPSDYNMDYHMYLDGELYWDGNPVKEDRYILMQFTGFLDKNKKEIFEGDIIKQGLGEILWDKKLAQFRVKWHDKTWLKIRGEFEEYQFAGSEPLFTNSHIAWEVIGNIYENPKLLKEER